MKYSSIALFLLSLCLVGAGCTNHSSPVRTPIYYWGILNNSEQILRDLQFVAVDDTGKVVDSLALSQRYPGQGWHEGPGLAPIATIGKLTWCIDSVNNEQTLAVASVLPDAKTFHGTIWLVYRGPEKRWKVVSLSEDEKWERAAAIARGELSGNPNLPPPALYVE